MPVRGVTVSWSLASGIQGVFRAAVVFAAKVGLDHEVNGRVPVYHQIADRLRELIVRGELTDGAELPSVRELAACVRVNPKTVAKAYRLLADEGLVDLSDGARVRVPRGFAVQAPEVDTLERQLRDVVSRMVLSGAKRPDIERFFHRVLERFYGPVER
jgi:GntR family transcriptional regulator